MKIKYCVYMVRQTCVEALKYIKVEQDKRLEKEIKAKMSGWFACTSREKAIEEIGNDRWFQLYNPYLFHRKKMQQMLDALNLSKCIPSQDVYTVELNDEEASDLLGWRKRLKLDETPLGEMTTPYGKLTTGVGAGDGGSK